MSWVTKDTKGRHELVPEAVHAEAEKYAKVRLLRTLQCRLAWRTARCVVAGRLPVLLSKPSLFFLREGSQKSHGFPPRGQRGCQQCRLP